MQAHGMFKIEDIDDVIRTYPTGAFNLEGIKSVRQVICSKAVNKKEWGLFEHPDKDSGLTPDAVNQLLTFCKKLEEKNCLFVCLEVDSMWEGYVENLFKEFNLKNAYLNPCEATFRKLKNSLDS